MNSKLKALWLSILLVFGSSLVAQSNPGTCDIIDSGTTVPQFCHSSLGGGPLRLEGPFSLQISRLNFTLNGSILVFTPLPENRQSEIEIDDNSKVWTNLANALVDSIGSGSLPYGNAPIV